MNFFILTVLFIGIALIFLSATLFGRAVFSGSLGFIKTKTKEAKATVRGKYKVDKLRSSGVYTVYFMRFQLSENDSMEVPVSKKIFKKAMPNDTGTLFYKGSYFVDFILDRDVKKKEEAPKEETYILNGEVVKK